MYAFYTPRTAIDIRSAFTYLSLGLAGALSVLGNHAAAQSSVIRNITSDTERLELTVNSSRILTLEKRIPRMVVNNPDLITVTAISANQVQIAARKPGVTQVNLWDEDGKVYSIDVMIYGDVQELQLALTRLFPQSSIKVVRLTNSLVLEGFVERPEAVGPIIRLAEDYAPKVINNITVGGVQQVMLKVKVMEVSRTKLRRLGVDWAQTDGSSFVASGITGLISSFSAGGVESRGGTFAFGIVDGTGAFAAILDALQQNSVAKILADPTITTVSGRPAEFLVGGELPILVPSGLGQTSIEYKDFGTRVSFLPIVLGNGKVRLEVRAEVSEIDDTRSIVLDSFVVPALRTSFVDTGVEMKSGQTLALAGLIQTRVDAIERGLPFVSDIPYIGAAFRSVEEEVSEIELLILVTPEFVDGMDPHEVPPCGPGMESVSPTNRQLYFGGHLEVPSCGICAPGNCGAERGSNCNSCSSPGQTAVITDGMYQLNQPETYGVPTPSSGAIPVEQTPLLQPEMPNPIPSPAGEALPDPTTMRSSPRLWNRMPAQFSRGKPSYRSASQQPVIKTVTPGLIGPLGYDTGN